MAEGVGMFFFCLKVFHNGTFPNMSLACSLNRCFHTPFHNVFCFKGMNEFEIHSQTIFVTYILIYKSHFKYDAFVQLPQS